MSSSSRSSAASKYADAELATLTPLRAVRPPAFPAAPSPQLLARLSEGTLGMVPLPCALSAPLPQAPSVSVLRALSPLAATLGSPREEALRSGAASGACCHACRETRSGTGDNAASRYSKQLVLCKRVFCATPTLQATTIT